MFFQTPLIYRAVIGSEKNFPFFSSSLVNSELLSYQPVQLLFCFYLLKSLQEKLG